MRVVSLNCSKTEIVCASGYSHFLVGIDSHPDRPADDVIGLLRVHSTGLPRAVRA
jgi:ABC-type hemin transport system substrate-binding protein